MSRKIIARVKIMMMSNSNSYLLTISLCSFVCFHVTADLNLAENDVGELDQIIYKDSLNKRDAYQNPLLNSHMSKLSGEWIEDLNWPAKNNIRLGQVAGVTVNGRGEVVVFHRGSHVWNSFTFDLNNVYRPKSDGPISDPTVLIFHPESGELLQRWGENMFFLPHGVTVDHEENLWLTDVGLHQVFKFPPLHKNERAALLTLGKAFTPGNSAVRFCKPTSVAVTPTGDFFVADGYCNSRIVKFNKHGEKILEFGQATWTSGLMTPGPYQFRVPHALTLAEEYKIVCVADRENGRVLCFDSTTGKDKFQISAPQIGSRVFSVTYSPVEGGIFVIVNGYEIDRYNPVKVQTFVVSASSRHILSTFSNLQTPHDVAISPDGRTVYVVEIGPNVIHKYTYNGTFNSSSINTTASDSSKITVPISPQSLRKPISLGTGDGTVLPAVLVTCAAILFGATIIVAALVYSRARRRGCGHCGSRRWMLGRSPAEGFMIGHLLGQHQGFEKLSTTEESEEEITSLQPFA